MISDPKLLALNETQLFFEAESINLEDKRKYDDMALVAKAAKKAIINLLGLNIIPLEDSKTGLLRMPEDHEVVPLVALIGHEGILKGIKEKIDDMQAQDLTMQQLEEEKKSGKDMATDEFVEFMESDLEFIDEAEVKRRAIINSPEYEYLSKNVVKDISKDAEKRFEEIFGSTSKMDPADLKKLLSENIHAADGSESKETEVLEGNIKIESEEIFEDDSYKSRKRSRIIIEPDDEDE